MHTGSVFISYSRQDEDIARALKDRLNDAKIVSFMDTSQIRPGDYWRRETAEALDSAALVVVVCTSNSVVSHEVTAEWAYAAGRGLTVVPVIYESNLHLPGGLGIFDRLDFVDPAHRQWDRLISRIQEVQRENPITSGVIRRLGIESIFSGRDQLLTKHSVSQILEKAVPGSELLVVGRSLEAWSREFQKIHYLCSEKALRLKMGVVDPAIDSAEWLVPGDYAKVDLPASIEKFRRMEALPALTQGSFELFFLPNSTLFSFTCYRDALGLCGIYEISANLSFDDRCTFILRSESHEPVGLLKTVLGIVNGIFTTRPPVFSAPRSSGRQ